MKLSLSRDNLRLDALSLLIAGLRDGFGPLLTFFFVRELRFNPAEIGILLAIPSFTDLLFQIPIGLWIDRNQSTRKLLSLAAGLFGFSAIAVSMAPPFWVVLILQGTCGLSMALFSVCLTSVSFNIAGRSGLGARVARNEALAKIGNIGMLAASGALAQFYRVTWIFYVVAAFSFLTFTLAPFLKAESIPAKRSSHRAVWKEPWLRTLLLSSLFYQMANTPMFNLAEQIFARSSPGGVGRYSFFGILTQVVLIASCLILGRDISGRTLNRLFRIGFILVAIRGLVLATGISNLAVLTAQILDGVIAAILILVPIRIVALKIPNRFNLVSAAFGTTVGLGSGLSMTASGFLLQSTGEKWPFLISSILACLGVLIFSLGPATDTGS